MSCFPKRAFTLVELLIVIGIIAVLISILLPSLAKARDAATLIACANNQKQIYLGLSLYANDNHGRLPPPAARGYQLGLAMLYGGNRDYGQAGALIYGKYLTSVKTLMCTDYAIIPSGPQYTTYGEWGYSVTKDGQALNPDLTVEKLQGLSTASDWWMPIAGTYSIYSYKEPSDFTASGCRTMAPVKYGTNTMTALILCRIDLTSNPTTIVHQNRAFNATYSDGHVRTHSGLAGKKAMNLFPGVQRQLLLGINDNYKPARQWCSFFRVFRCCHAPVERSETGV